MQVSFSPEKNFSSLKIKQAYETFRQMIEVVSFLPFYFGKEGCVVYYKEKYFLIPYASLYNKISSKQKLEKDLTYNLEHERHYKRINKEEVPDIGEENAFFNFLLWKKFLPSLKSVILLVEEIERENESIEVVFDLNSLDVIFHYGEKILWRGNYETLRSRYLEKDEKIAKLKETIRKKFIREKEREKYKLLRTGAKEKYLSFLSSHGLSLLEDYKGAKEKHLLQCECGEKFDYHLNVLVPI